ncbi:MAG: hypothetical protein R3C20_03205 [Planctomycetaceae bacterium]
MNSTNYPIGFRRLRSGTKQLAEQLADPLIYRGNSSKAAEIGTRMQKVEEDLLHCLERWNCWNP